MNYNIRTSKSEVNIFNSKFERDNPRRFSTQLYK